MKGQEAAVLPNLGFMWLMAAGWWWWGGWFLTSPGPGRPRIFSSASSSFSNSFNFRVHLKQTEFLIGYQTSTNQGNIPKDEDEKVNRLRTGPISFSAKFSLSPCLSPSLSASRLPCSSLYHAPPPSSSLLLPLPPSSSFISSSCCCCEIFSLVLALFHSLFYRATFSPRGFLQLFKPSHIFTLGVHLITDCDVSLISTPPLSPHLSTRKRYNVYSADFSNPIRFDILQPFQRYRNITLPGPYNLCFPSWGLLSFLS